MKFVIFGLTITSSWGNGHATLLRGLFRALVRRGHQVTFFERDQPYYANNRDLWELAGVRLKLYSDWDAARPVAEGELRDSDIGMVTSYCPDGVAATELVLSSRAYRVFYDLDTPVTLEKLRNGDNVSYIGPNGLTGFDLVLSYAGGYALQELRTRLGAANVAPFYGWVDPSIHKPAQAVAHYHADLSYLGTYAEDRQKTLEQLFIEPARKAPHRRFVIGGATYPGLFPWTENIYFVRHLPPQEHSAFFSSSRLTLNITRRAMVETGYCPSGRLFEAAACGTPVLTDEWAGLEQFFEPNREILTARCAEEVLAAVDLPTELLHQVAAAARNRVLEQHTADHRVMELEKILQSSSISAIAPEFMSGHIRENISESDQAG